MIKYILNKSTEINFFLSLSQRHWALFPILLLLIFGIVFHVFAQSTFSLRNKTGYQMQWSGISDGQFFSPGEVITLKLNVDGDPPIDSVVFIGNDWTEFDSQSPFEVSYTIPENTQGSIHFLALGKVGEELAAATKPIELIIIKNKNE